VPNDGQGVPGCEQPGFRGGRGGRAVGNANFNYARAFAPRAFGTDRAPKLLIDTVRPRPVCEPRHRPAQPVV